MRRAHLTWAPAAVDTSVVVEARAWAPTAVDMAIVVETRVKCTSCHQGEGKSLSIIYLRIKNIKPTYCGS